MLTTPVNGASKPRESSGLYSLKAAGEGVELVLICEVPDEQAGEISSLALDMSNADNTATISLY